MKVNFIKTEFTVFHKTLNTARKNQNWRGVDKRKTRDRSTGDHLWQSPGMVQTSGQIHSKSKTKHTSLQENKGLFYRQRKEHANHIASVFKNVLWWWNLVIAQFKRKTLHKIVLAVWPELETNQQGTVLPCITCYIFKGNSKNTLIVPNMYQLLWFTSQSNATDDWTRKLTICNSEWS